MDLFMIERNGEYGLISISREQVDRPKGTGIDCYLCQHSTDDRTCKAFDRIPDDIWYGKVDHTKPYPGDNGIQFEEIK